MRKYFWAVFLFVTAAGVVGAGEGDRTYNLNRASDGVEIVSAPGATVRYENGGVGIGAGSEAQILLPPFEVGNGQLTLRLEYLPPFIHQFMWYDGRVLELQDAQGEAVLTLDLVRRGRFRLEYRGVGAVSLPMDRFDGGAVDFVVVIDGGTARLEVNGQRYLQVFSASPLAGAEYRVVLANAVTDAEKICAYGTYRRIHCFNAVPAVPAPAYDPGAGDVDYEKLKALETRIISGEDELAVRVNNSGTFSRNTARKTVCRVVLDSLYRRLNIGKRVNFDELYRDLLGMVEAMEKEDAAADVTYDLPEEAAGFLTPEDDNFHFGAIGWDQGQYARDLAGLGFNLVSDSFWPNQVMRPDGSFNQDYYVNRIGPSLRHLERYGLKVDMLLAPYTPDYLKQRHPEWSGAYFGSDPKDAAEAASIGSAAEWRGRVAGYGFLEASIIDPEFLAMAETFLKESARRLNQHSNVVSLCLGNESLFADYSEPMQRRWREYLRTKYTTLAALNAAWRSDYASFDEIFMNYIMAHDYENAPRFYDWTCFNQAVGTEFFRFLHDTVKSECALPTHVKVLPDEYGSFWLGLHDPDRASSEYAAGIDRYGIAQFTEILGTDSYADKWTGDGDLQANVMHQSIYLDLLASYDYDKAVFDSEWHIFNIGAPRTPAAYADFVMQENVMHNIRAGSVWLMCPEVDVYDLTSDAPLLLTYAQTAAKIRAFKRYYDALLRRPRPVALLYSPENRRTFFDGYMHNLRSWHRESLFRGAGVRVMDERQLIAGNYRGVQTLVVVPTPILTAAARRALAEFAGQGGRVILLGTSGEHQGQPLDEIAGKKLPKMTAADSWNAIDAPAFITGADGRSIHGVEWHCADLDAPQTVILYVSNYNRNPQEIFLRRLKNPRDAFSGRPLAFPLTLETWQTLLIVGEK